MTVYVHNDHTLNGVVYSAGRRYTLPDSVERALISAGKALTVVTPAQPVDYLLDSAGRLAGMAPTDGEAALLARFATNATGVIGVAAPGGAVQGASVSVATSRALTAADDGCVIECTAGGLTITVPAGLPTNFGCVVVPNGTTTVASSGGALINGATTSLTRTAASNPTFAIVARTAANSYVVTGL